jgi:hypothetical protein
MVLEFFLFKGIPVVLLLVVLVGLFLNERPTPHEVVEYLVLLAAAAFLVLIGLFIQTYEPSPQPERVKENNVWLPSKIKPEDWI